MHLALAATLALSAAAADKPSAVRVCFTGLEADAPLFADAPRRGYRKLGDAYVLDLDLTLDGAAPEKLTRSDAGCVKAWLPPRRVSSIAVSFDRTETNYEPAKRAVKLQLKADLWHDGGSFAITRRPFARVTTSLPGTLEAVRVEGGRELPVPDPARLAIGRYRFRHVPPPPPAHPCQAQVIVDEAIGSIRADNRPKDLEAIVADYRKTIAPKVLAEKKQTCTGDEVVELHIRVREGTIPNAWTPHLRKLAKPKPRPPYVLKVDGAARPLGDADVIEVGYGQVLEVGL